MNSLFISDFDGMRSKPVFGKAVQLRFFQAYLSNFSRFDNVLFGLLLLNSVTRALISAIGAEYESTKEAMPTWTRRAISDMCTTGDV